MAAKRAIKRAMKKSVGGPLKRRDGKKRASAMSMSAREVRLLEGTFLGVLVLLIVGSLGLTSLGGVIVHSNQSAAVEAAVMVDLTNENRIQNALPGLTIDPDLVKAAQEKADDEAAKGYFAHTSPEGIDSWHWFAEAGYSFMYAGENLAVDFTDSAAVMSAWMNSPTHRANILNGHYTQIGIATASGMYEGHPTIFVVQEFGSPAAHTVASAPIAAATQPSEPTQIAEATTLPVSSPTISAPITVAQSLSHVEARQVTRPAQSPTRTNDGPRTDIRKPKVLGDSASSEALPTTDLPTPASMISVDRIAPELAQAESVALPMSSATALATVPVRYSSDLAYFLASPEATLRYAYYAIAFLVLVALLLTTGLELRMHHLRSMVVAGTLTAVMLGLFLVADASVFGHPTITQSASAIASFQPE